MSNAIKKLIIISGSFKHSARHVSSVFSTYPLDVSDMLSVVATHILLHLLPLIINTWPAHSRGVVKRGAQAWMLGFREHVAPSANPKVSPHEKYIFRLVATNATKC